MSALVGLTDVKQFLNMKSAVNDAELSGFLTDAVSAVVDVIGPLAATQFTTDFDRFSYALVLDHTPVQSVQSVLIAPWLGAAVVDDTAAWVPNLTTGVLRRKLVSGVLPWLGSGSVITVTYTAGRVDVPNPVNRAILYQVRSMWATQRGAMPLPAGGEDSAPVYAGEDGLLAPEVMELLLPYLPPPGVA